MTLLVLIPILTFVTVILLALSMAAPKQDTIAERISRLGQARQRPGGDLSASFGQRVVRPFLAKLARLVMRLTPAGIVAGSQLRLRQAHSSVGLGTFLLLRLILAALLPAFILLPSLMKGAPIGLRDWAIAIALVYIGHKLPDIWLSFKIDGRREQITRALPDALDLIVVCVEAGYSLEAALAKVVEKTNGPLADEFEQTLAEVSLGRTRREALHDLSERAGSSDLQTFIAAILQADQMGVSIADALRVQSDAMRVRRRQRAEELIAKAPVKMLFPMTVFIFPALFVVLLGPAGIHILRIFQNM